MKVTDTTIPPRALRGNDKLTAAYFPHQTGHCQVIWVWGVGAGLALLNNQRWKIRAKEGGREEGKSVRKFESSEAAGTGRGCPSYFVSTIFPLLALFGSPGL